MQIKHASTMFNHMYFVIDVIGQSWASQSSEHVVIYIYISFGPLMFKILFSNQCLVACMYDTAASRQVWQAWSHPSFRPSTLTGGVLQAWENGEFVIYIYIYSIYIYVCVWKLLEVGLGVPPPELVSQAADLIGVLQFLHAHTSWCKVLDESHAPVLCPARLAVAGVGTLQLGCIWWCAVTWTSRGSSGCSKSTFGESSRYKLPAFDTRTYLLASFDRDNAE